VAELSGGVEQVAGYEVVPVLGQFVLGDEAGEVVNGCRVHEQEHDPADDFEGTVEAFEGDTDPEGPVKGA
jgi:hypothetical protein